MQRTHLVLAALGLTTGLIVPFTPPPLAQCPVGETIDFECDPGTGLPFLDTEVVTDQYDIAPYFVRFSLIGEDSTVGPRIARVGSPRTAFTGPVRSECGVGPTDHDMPAADQSVGCFFLTDDQSTSTSHDLRIDYTVPTFQAAGRILDVQAGGFTEEWTITAHDELDAPFRTIVITEGDPGTGDGIATTWAFDADTLIHAVELVYTGGGNPGLAFDFFSPRSLGCAEINAPTDTLACDPLTGLVDVSLDLTNRSGVDVHHIALTPPEGIEIIPNLFSAPTGGLSAPIADGETVTLFVQIAGAEFGGPVCVTATMMDSTVTECCSGGVCVSVAPCPCLIVSDEVLTCVSQDTGELEWSFTLTNATPDVAEHLYLFEGAFAPNHVELAGLGPGDSTAVTTTLLDLPAGSSSLYRLSLHDAFLNSCCSVERSLDSPCSPPAAVGDGSDSPGLRAFVRPNPFNPATRITFSLARGEEVSVRVYTPAGRLVSTLFEGSLPRSVHTVHWDGRDGTGRAQAAGIYLYRIETEGASIGGKLVLQK